MKIAFIGSGSVASSTAFISGIEGLFDEIIMLDIFESFAKGKAIDLEQGFILNGKNTKVIGTSDYKNVEGSDVIVVTAGIANKTSGSSNREHLLSKNKEIIFDVATKLSGVIPNDAKQPLVIIVTNPLDIILKHFVDIGGFSKQKTIGSGNWLDSARFKYYLSKELNIDSNKIETYVAGQHGQKMVYLLSQTKINGQALFDYMKENKVTDDTIKNICEKSTHGAYEIINLLQKEGTTFGPAVSIYNIIESYVMDLKKIIPISIYFDNKYGIENCCAGLPVVIGKDGVEKICDFDITESEKIGIKNSCEFMEEVDK
jgi:malate dehydrogenase